MPRKSDNSESPAPPRGFLRPGEDPVRRVYLCPAGPVTLAAGGLDNPGGCWRVLVRGGDGGATVAWTAPEERVREWAGAEGAALARHVEGTMARAQAPRPLFAGLALGRPLLMGVINVTPDSFSDGGEALAADAAIARGGALLEAGADILDVGGESTRPGAAPVPEAEELARVLPVVGALASTGAVVSIDTRRAAVMARALEAGAGIINDVTALTGDGRSLEVAAAGDAAVVLMHMRGEPGTMQDDPRYDDAALDIHDDLAGRVAALTAAGKPLADIAVDPGIGFGKTVAHNSRVLDLLGVYHGLGCALALGVSRKSFIAALSRGEEPGARLAGSLAAALAGVMRGVHILRVHDVAETRQALAVWRAIAGAGRQAP